MPIVHFLNVSAGFKGSQSGRFEGEPPGVAGVRTHTSASAATL